MSATNRTLQLRSRERQAKLQRIKSMRADPAYSMAESRITMAADDDDEVNPASWMKRKFVLGLIMAPLCLVALVVFFDLFFNATVRGAFWRSEGFWFFAFGCLFWFTLGWVRMQPTLAYVFAHEMTHAITARLSGGKIHDMQVNVEGGYIETDKTNAFITLSPYLVPFYTVVVFCIYWLISLGVDMQHLMTFDLFGTVLALKWNWIFYFFIGLTWCFHLTYTMQVLKTEQSDLLHNGEFFSMMLIFLTNLVILLALFVAASQTVGWTDVWQDVTSMGVGLWEWVEGY